MALHGEPRLCEFMHTDPLHHRPCEHRVSDDDPLQSESVLHTDGRSISTDRKGLACCGTCRRFQPLLSSWLCRHHPNQS